ncbi:MAG: replicative DNA helicase [Firmicutes bacterium]|nr:replicative DNA helicase [Bacillota bacterium]MDY3658884.1 replicative DNA helicase [Eubacteriales bacterium]
MDKKKDYKTMPHSIEAEQSVLGSMLINNEAPLTILSALCADDFYSNANKLIFSKMQELYRANTPIDFVTLTDILDKCGELENVGGIDYITTLTNILPSATNFQYYVDIVKRDSLFRKLIQSGQKIIENAYEATDDKSALKFAEKEIFDISEQQDFSSLEHIDGALKEVMEKLNKIAKDPNSLRGLSTGLTDLDAITNGLQNSDLILIAARPGVGKTSLAMNLVNNVAIQGKKSCAIFSLEMPRTQIAQRSMCSIGGVSMEKALKGQLSVDEWTALVKASRKLSEAKIYIDDSSLNDPNDILSKCRRIKREHGLDLVMIDYLQLMRADKNSNYDNKVLEVGEITRSLKIAARELDVPIILLSQLSRAVESRKGDHRPVLSDLRDSGSIEQDADIVMFIYKPDMYNDVVSEEPDIAELIIAKHRNGPLGTVKLKWVGETTSFENYSKSYVPKNVVAQPTDDQIEAPLSEDELNEIKDLF